MHLLLNGMLNSLTLHSKLILIIHIKVFFLLWFVMNFM